MTTAAQLAVIPTATDLKTSMVAYLEANGGTVVGS